MARLSKAQLGDRGRFVFDQEEIELPEILGDDDKPGTVLVRTPTVGTRDALAKKLPDDEKAWSVEEHVALLFSTVVVDPELSQEEAAEFLEDWPASALDKIISQWSKMIGTDEEMRQSAGEFRPSN